MIYVKLKITGILLKVIITLPGLDKWIIPELNIEWGNNQDQDHIQWAINIMQMPHPIHQTDKDHVTSVEVLIT